MNRWCIGLVLVLGSVSLGDGKKIEFVEETLDNGMRVIYAPLKTAPVVHVRVLYRVGSKDERPDRQGFAHMFEHMMFRGSAHVQPEEHMKRVGMVGGNSNAFTSVDQTVYLNTVPSNYLEMVLYLEADRLASFKVSPEIYKTERNVVGEEWRMKFNRPYGNMHEEFMKLAFTEHGYRWTTIGSLEHLAAAQADELQAFFNNYYVPNNAILVIAGDIDVAKAKEMVRKYYAWIPKGADPDRPKRTEPEQAEPRRAVREEAVPAPAITMGYKLPPFTHEDHYAIAMLGSILSGGRAGRLDVALVNNEKPMCTSVSAGPWQLADGGLFFVNANVMAGQKAEDVERVLKEELEKAGREGVTAEELERAKVAARISWARGRQTATDIATQLGHEALFGGDPNRVNTEMAKLEAVTAADVQRVAKEYLRPERSTTLIFNPKGPGAPATAPATKADTRPAVNMGAPFGVPARRPATTQAAGLFGGEGLVTGEPFRAGAGARDVKFPEGWPKSAPMSEEVLKATFEKGVEKEIDGVKAIVMTDSRLPLVSWSITMRRGSHAEAKEGLGWLTAELVRRGPAGTTFGDFNRHLESKGITIEVSDGGDYTRISGSSMSDQLEEGLAQTRKVLREPLFSPTEFANLQKQLIDVLRRQQASADTVAGNELGELVWGDTPLGRYATPESLASITLDDVKAYYRKTYIPDAAIVMIAGDVTVERGQALAGALLADWKAQVPSDHAGYDFPPVPQKRRIVVVDRPEGRQSTVRMGIRAYDIRSDEKFAGAVANQILTAGIESRLGRHVRAKKGLAYSVHGVFQPRRQGGWFWGGTDTALPSTAAAVEAMFEVFDEMRKNPVSAEELADAKMRVTGGMVMSLQTINQQANMRVDGILNGYPIDYYDKYPERVSQVSAEQVQQVMQKYVRDDAMTVVIVAPAAAVREQLEKLGEVKVVPMPAQRRPATQPAQPAAKEAA